MDERISYVTSELEKIAEGARSDFGKLSGSQLNWKPSETGWSVGQCLEHLIKTNEQFFPEFEKLASGNRRNSFWQNYSPLTGWCGRFLIKAVTEDSKKSKAPSKSIVPPSEVGDDIVERFRSNISDVNSKINACADADRMRTIVSSPFLAVLTYTLEDAYTILVEHSKRHIRQAGRVLETEGFPK